MIIDDIIMLNTKVLNPVFFTFLCKFLKITVFYFLTTKKKYNRFCKILIVCKNDFRILFYFLIILKCS